MDKVDKSTKNFTASELDISIDFNTPEEVQDLRARRLFRSLIMIVATMFVFQALLDLFVSTDRLPRYEGAGVQYDSRSEERGSALTNPEYSWIERHLCFGYQTSSFCSNKDSSPVLQFEREYSKESYDEILKRRGALIPRQNKQAGTRYKRLSNMSKRQTF